MLSQKIAWLQKSQMKFPPLDSDQAGLWGEQLAFEELQKFLRKLPGKFRIFRSLRVPKKQGSGKFEIDLLLVSEKAILVIEVKNWGGSLSKNKTGWIQERGAEKKTLQDPIRLNQEKLQSLRAWLALRGMRLPEKVMHSRVLFTHAKVQLSADLKKSTELLDRNSLRDFVANHCALPRRHFWQKKPATDYDFASLIEVLEQLPTWDRLELHGGRVLFGDLEYMSMPSIRASAMQRKYLQSAIVRMSRRLFPGIFLGPKLRVEDWAGRRKVYPLHPDARLVFRLAGQNAKEEIPWMHVESLQLGWKDQSYYDESSVS